MLGLQLPSRYEEIKFDRGVATSARTSASWLVLKKLNLKE